MAKGKSFKDEDAVKEFLSNTEDNDNTESPKEEKTSKEEVKSEKKVIENMNKLKKNKDMTGRQGTLFEIPKKLEDAKKSGSGFEAKSKKFQMLIQPSVFEKIKEIAELRDEKINSYIHSLLEKAIKDEGK